MIPSDHFVRYYNEVFKALEDRGHEHLQAYWREIGELQKKELAESFRRGGLRACHDYWARILKEENCVGNLTLTDDYFEFRMDVCPSLSKALDNDAGAFQFYCDHCMGWVEPLMQAAGLHPVHDIESRTEAHCVFRVYLDQDKATAFEKQCRLPAKPYA